MKKAPKALDLSDPFSYGYTYIIYGHCTKSQGICG